MTFSARTAAPLTVALALLACSREAPPPAPKADDAFSPASGQAAPQRRAAGPRCAENFRAFDENADGRVSRAEFDARPHAHPDPAGVFAQRDRDADGALTEHEFCSAWRGPGPGPAAGPRLGPGAGPGARGGGMHHRGMGRPMMGMRCEAHFDAFDTDKDGKVSAQEFAAWPHARGDAAVLFAERDSDKDGVLTRAEFCAPRR